MFAAHNLLERCVSVFSKRRRFLKISQGFSRTPLRARVCHSGSRLPTQRPLPLVVLVQMHSLRRGQGPARAEAGRVPPLPEHRRGNGAAARARPRRAAPMVMTGNHSFLPPDN
eukprot:gene117-biopygen248